MKLLLVIVSVIAVCTVDCRDFPEKHEDLDYVDEAQHLPGEPGGYDSPSEDPKPNETEEESNQKEISLAVAQEPQDVDSSEIDQQPEKPAITKTGIQDLSLEDDEDQQDHSLRRVGCKARNACVVMAGFCVTNTTLCGGRLVPEGCKGTGCQCCVPGTLETKINNLSDDNSKLSMDLQDLKDNLTDASSHQNMEFLAMKENLTDANSKLNMELQTLKDILNSSISIIGSKLDSIMRRCPVGFFHTAGSSQCYKFYNDTHRSWTSAKEKCQSEGLVLAEPANPISLRKYLVETYGDVSYGFLGARGTGSYFEWERSGRQISNSDSLWMTGHPGTNVKTSNCLLLLAQKGTYLTSYPNQPYHASGCNSKYYTVCEYVME